MINNIYDMLAPAANVTGRPVLRTSSRGDYIVPCTPRKFGKKAFSVQARWRFPGLEQITKGT